MINNAYFMFINTIFASVNNMIRLYKYIDQQNLENNEIEIYILLILILLLIYSRE